MEEIYREYYIADKEVDIDDFMTTLQQFFEEEDVSKINNLFINEKFCLRVKDVVYENGKIKRIER